MKKLNKLVRAGSSGGSAPGYNADSREFAPQTSHPLLGPLSLNGYKCMTENLTTENKGTDHPTPSCRWPSIMGAATCPSATLT